MLARCTALVFMLRAISRLLERLCLKMKTSHMCFRLALIYSTNFIFFLYRHLHHLVLQPSANIMVCGDFNAHNTELLCHSHTTDIAGLFCQEFAMAQDLTQVVDLPTRIPDRDDHQPYVCSQDYK